MNKSLIAAFALTIACLANAAPAVATPAQDQGQIELVIDTFKTTIIKKDVAAFMSLFYSETIPWIGVTTDNSLKRFNSQKQDPLQPDEEKIYATGNPKKFIESIAKRSASVEETFDNVRIDSNGDVAQVYFDYSFVENGYRQNWGQESWQLVRTPDGWKINSVIWSMEFNPEPPPKP